VTTERAASRDGGGAVVTYADAQPSGVADLVGRLLEGNLAAHPERAALLRPAVVEIRATDAGVAVALDISPGGIVVHDTAVAGAAATAQRATAAATARRDVVIASTSARLLEVAAAPLLGGIPDPRRREGRAVLGAIVARRIRISGLVRRVGTVRRFSQLLSVAEG
jgi:hypothetical protein